MKVYDVPVVFFDLDDSLINKDANSLWIRWRFRRDRWAMVEGVQALLSLYRAYKKAASRIPACPIITGLVHAG